MGENNCRASCIVIHPCCREDNASSERERAVSLLASSGRPLAQVATELGIQPSMLRSWRGTMNDAVKQMPGASGSLMASAPSAEQAEIRRLRRELERVEMERDILKKAVGIFSGPPR